MWCVCVCETGGKKVGDTEEGEGAGEREKKVAQTMQTKLLRLCLHAPASCISNKIQ